MTIHILELTAVEFTYDKFVHNITLYLHSRGLQVSIAFNNTTSSSSASNAYNFPFYSLPIYRNFNLIAIFKAASQLKYLTSAQSVDVVHCHSPAASLVARVARFLGMNSKVLYTVHGFYFHDQMARLPYCLYFAVEYILAFFTDAFTFVSREDYELAVRFKLSSNLNLHHIPNGVNVNIFSQCNNSRTNHIVNKPIVLGIASRLVHEKGIPELIHAISLLFAVNPNIQLRICGEALDSDRDSSGIPCLIDALSELYPNRIEVLGMLPSHEMPSFYQSLDIFILPSRREGLPMVLIEAQSCGLIVVATSIRGCREIILDSHNGFLFPLSDSYQLYVLLSSIINSRTDLDLVKSQARFNAQLNYNQINILPEYFNVICGL